MPVSNAIKAARAAIELFLEDKTQRGLNASFRNLQRFGSRIRNLGRQLALASAPPVLALAAAVREFASQEQIFGRFQSVFGNLSASANEFARNLSSNVNQSVIAVRDEMATFQAILRGFGLEDTTALGLSTQLAVAAEDLVAFDDNIRGSQEAVRRLVSGLSGELEAVRRLGADVSKAAVDHELLASGMVKVTDEARQADRVVARFNIIMRALGRSGATGQARREVNTLASVFRGLRADIRDTAGIIGAALAPTVQGVIRPVRTFLRNLQVWVRINPEIARSIGLITVALPTLAAALIAAGAAIQVFAAALTALQIGLKAVLLVSSLPPLILAVGAAVGVAVVAFGRWREAALQVGRTLRTELLGSLRALQEFVLGGEIEKAFELAGNLAATGFLRGFGALIDELRFSLIRSIGELAIATNPTLTNQPREAKDAVLDAFVGGLRDQTEKQFRSTLLDLQERRIELVNEARALFAARVRRERSQRRPTPSFAPPGAPGLIPDSEIGKAREKLRTLAKDFEEQFNPAAAFRSRIEELRSVQRLLSPFAFRNAVQDAQQQFRQSARSLALQGLGEQLRETVSSFTPDAVGAFGGAGGGALFAQERQRIQINERILAEQERTTGVIEEVDETIKRVMRFRFR